MAAGLGTRMLPATKAVPKELFPVVDRPLIQYAVEEAASAGARHVIMVVAPGKEAIAEHFSDHTRANEWAEGSGDPNRAALVERPGRLARIDFVSQEKPLGIAHAVACAREHVEGEPFALMFPDDLILSEQPCLAQLAGAYSGEGSMLAVQRVAESELSQYGVVDPISEGNPVRLRGIVEKPRPTDAPSNLGVVGRYILGASIFRHIDGLTAGVKSELQITDALARQIEAGESVVAYRYTGDRFDTGRPLGYLVAGVAAGLRDGSLGGPLRARLAELLVETSE